MKIHSVYYQGLLNSIHGHLLYHCISFKFPVSLIIPFPPQSSPVRNTFHSPPLCVCILIFRQKYSSRTLSFSPWPTAPNLTLILLSPSQLLCIDVQKRISCLAELQELDYMSDVNWDAVLNKQLPPGFIPNASIWHYSSALLIYIRQDCWNNLLADLMNSDESDWSINHFFKPKNETQTPYVFKNTHSLYNISKEEMKASPPVGLRRNPRLYKRWKRKRVSTCRAACGFIVRRWTETDSASLW